MSQVQIYSGVFKEWQNAESLGPVRVSSMIPDSNGIIIYTNDILACEVPDKVEGYSLQTYRVFISHGVFMIINLRTDKSIPLHEYRSGMRIVGNTIEGSKLMKVK